MSENVVEDENGKMKLEITLPDDFVQEDELVLKRERKTVRGSPMYLQIVEGQGGNLQHLSPYYIVKGAYSGTDIVAHCDSINEAKAELIRLAQEESNAN